MRLDGTRSVPDFLVFALTRGPLIVCGAYGAERAARGMCTSADHVSAGNRRVWKYTMANAHVPSISHTTLSGLPQRRGRSIRDAVMNVADGLIAEQATNSCFDSRRARRSSCSCRLP